MTLKQLFFLTLIFSFFSISSPTRADTCLDYQPGQSNNSCAAAYTRQQQILYFNSPQLGEQSFLLNEWFIKQPTPQFTAILISPPTVMAMAIYAASPSMILLLYI